MKKFLLLSFSLFIFLLFISSNGAAQVKKRYNRPFFGLNMGATYQQSDVRDMAHLGWGLTFGKYYMQNETNLFDFGWRLRYLHGVTEGTDGTRNYGIKNNIVLNGTGDSTLNYYKNGGFVYNNYKMTLDEGAFEVMLGLNRLREKTRIVLYGFGGIGLSGWQTKINQLDGSGMRYAYSGIDSTASAASALNQLNTIRDNSYETAADGNSKYKVHFVPSIGLGLGWQTRRGHYIGFEHRVTFTLTDYTDGIEQAGGGFFGRNNDIYNYTGVFIRWMIGEGSSSHHTTDPNGYSNNPPPPPTYTGNPTPPPHHTDPNGYSNNPPPPPHPNKPQVIINYPPTDPFTTGNNIITVTASVLNVNSRNEINVKVNGFPTQNFAYDMTTKALTVTSTLNTGNNSFYIMASNPLGSDWKSVNVIYEQGNSNPPMQQKPIITITNPATNPFTTNQNNITVLGTVLNVNSRNDITAYVNNVTDGNFKYDVSTKILSLTTNLNLGTNIIKFSATNMAGSDTKSQTIIYQNNTPPPPPPPAKPIVTITSPEQNPYTSGKSSQTVYATVQNVASSNDITVMVNGSKTTNFSYDSFTKKLMVTSNLIPGNNIFSVTGINSAGSDSKSVTIIFANHQSEQKPIVTITSPEQNPYNTSKSSQTVYATVQNVASSNDITVVVNGSKTTNFSYDSFTKNLTVTSNLIPGNNIFSVTGTNSAGSDSKSITVIYTKKEALPKPVVTIVSPENPFMTGKNYVDVNATVLNVSSKNDITVSVNSSSFTNFNYSTDTKTLTFKANNNPGTNKIMIIATNASGSDSKSLAVNYTVPVELPKPVVTITNPAANPFTSLNQNITITANVYNIGGRNDIKVTGPGGTNISNFTYDLNSKALSIPAALSSGDNAFTIAATNPQGSDSKSVTIKFAKKVAIGDGGGISIQPKPVVTFTNPATNPAIVVNPTVNFTATVLNVKSQNDIKITLNGLPFTNFTYNAATKTVTFTATMPLGANNKIIITATNSAGSDSKTMTVGSN